MPFRRGSVSGTCSRCGRTLWRRYPAEIAVCDCWKYCPICDPPFTVKMEAFSVDQNPRTYKVQDKLFQGEKGKQQWGAETIMVCKTCSPYYYSKQRPIEVWLS